MPAPISDEGKQLIQEVWDDLKQREASVSGRSVYRAAVSKIANDPKLQHIRIPGERTTQDIVGNLNKRYKELPPEEQEKDGSWSLSHLNDPLIGIPSEAVPTILNVWRFCVTFHEPFTIRDAKWVSHFYSFIPETKELYRIARIYSQNERSCAFSGEAFDSSPLDAQFVMDKWEYDTALWMGMFHKSSKRDELRSPRKIEDSSFSPSEQADMMISATMIARATKRKLSSKEYDIRWSDGLTGLQSVLAESIHESLSNHLVHRNEPDLSQRAMWLYACWLGYLHEGPKSDEFSPSEWYEIQLELLEWVRNHPWYTEEVDADLLRASKSLSWDSRFMPIDLLTKLGYKHEQPTIAFEIFGIPVSEQEIQQTVRQVHAEMEED